MFPGANYGSSRMAAILAENLSEKTVVGSDGAEVGTLYNVTMDLKSGELANLLVEPVDGAPDLDVEADEHGRFLIPVARVQAVKDHIVISR